MEQMLRERSNISFAIFINPEKYYFFFQKSSGLCLRFKYGNYKYLRIISKAEIPVDGVVLI